MTKFSMMKLPVWAAPLGYVVFCMATVCQLFLIFISRGVLDMALGNWKWESSDLVAPFFMLLSTGLGWIGWILHRPPTQKSRGLYTIFQLCLYGVPLFCSVVFIAGLIIAEKYVGLFLAATSTLLLLFSAATARYRRPSKNSNDLHLQQAEDYRKKFTDGNPPSLN